jgi:hypothetical protein
MCVGIVTKSEQHLQTIAQIEEYFKEDLFEYRFFKKASFCKECCTCQVDFQRFMSEGDRAERFEFDGVEYYEK